MICIGVYGEEDGSIFYFFSTLSFLSGLSACGLFGSTGPMSLAVSGAPSPFLLFSGSSWMAVECLVGVLERPFCLVSIAPASSDGAFEDSPFVIVSIDLLPLHLIDLRHRDLFGIQNQCAS